VHILNTSRLSTNRNWPNKRVQADAAVAARSRAILVM
jgi:hypothetical protein